MITALWIAVGSLALFATHASDGPLLRTASFTIFLLAFVGFWGNVLW